MADPAISIVLPTYNHLRYLKDAIDDIFRQTRQDWELIVINDGSTDGTAEWLNQQSHPQLRVIHQENQGAHAAINAGVRAARGTYLTWISADNRCASYFLEALAVPLDRDANCTLAYSSYFGIDETGRVFTIKCDNQLLLRELVSNAPRGNAGFLYRRAVHERVGLYESWVCDTLMWSRILDGGRSVFVLEPTYYYRFHSDRATLHHRAEVDADRPRVMAEFFERHGGAIDLPAMRMLYPGLLQAPAELASAATDFSVRMFSNGLPDRALNLQLSLLATSGLSDLLRVLVTFTGCARRAGLDPLPFVDRALQDNASLAAEQRSSLRDLSATLDAAQQAGLSLPTMMLEANHRLLSLEKPVVFSFAAWREQTGRGWDCVSAVPAH